MVQQAILLTKSLTYMSKTWAQASINAWPAYLKDKLEFKLFLALGMKYSMAFLLH